MDSVILYLIGALIALIGGFKACDWLISQKYKSKEDCEICRNSILETINKDRELLARLDTKMDLILECVKISSGDR